MTPDKQILIHEEALKGLKTEAYREGYHDGETAKEAALMASVRGLCADIHMAYLETEEFKKRYGEIR